MSSQAWWEVALPMWVQEPRLCISELDERAAIEILRVPDRVSHSLPHVVKHLPPDRDQFSGYSKCEGDKRWDSPKATGVSRGSSNSGQDSFLFLQTHLWFLSWSLNYRLPVSHTCLGSLQKALIVLQHITVLQSLKKKMLAGDWHETSKLILSAAWKEGALSHRSWQWKVNVLAPASSSFSCAMAAGMFSNSFTVWSDPAEGFFFKS